MTDEMRPSTRSEKNESQFVRSERIATEKEYDEHGDERSEKHTPRRVDREKVDKHEMNLRHPREPRKPEDNTEENFMSRRSKKPETLSHDRQLGSRGEASALSSKRSNEPEWMAADREAVNDENDSEGKTVDDFEQWKQSMKKNDGSGDAGLPPLQDQDVSYSSPLKKDDELAKEVRPPPGFEGAKVDSSDNALLSNMFASISATEHKADHSISVAPPGLVSKSSSVSVPAKTTGSSKFSKFFTQNQPSEAGSIDNRVTQDSKTPASSSTKETPATTRPTDNKDDVEGFERILAMLSSQSAPPSNSRTQRQPHSLAPKSDDQFRGPLQELSNHDYQGYRDSRHPQPHMMKDTNSLKPQNNSNYPSDSTTYDVSSRSPERNYVPAMRDSNATDTIMSNHTQNQDFFSSLLNQAHQSQSKHSAYQQHSPPNVRYGGPMGSFPPTDNRSPSNQRFSPPLLRSQYDARDLQAAHNSYGASHMSDERQQMLHHQQGQSYQQPSRDRSEQELLNQLMREQRLSSSREAAQYQQPPSSFFGPAGRTAPQGFVTGVGSRPGPGWNGQFEIDPRIPNASTQYHP